MAQQQRVQTISGARVEPLDDLPLRLGRDRLRLHLTWVSLALSGLALPAVLYASLIGGLVRNEGYVFMLIIYGPLICAVWLALAVSLMIAANSRSARARRVAERRRVEHLAVYQWFEVWADDPARPPPERPWSTAARTFLHLFVHPDAAVPRFLTRGTDLVVTGGCTADDLHAVTAHLDVVLHRALLLGLDDRQVRTGIRPVPTGSLAATPGRRHWEVHDPAAAHALIAADLASGWPPSALIAHYRGLLSAGSAAR